MSYTKQDWASKTVVTKSGLINMDNQIEANEQSASTNSTAITNITTGTTVVGKATADANGNNIANTYAPKTGEGASGTWGIGISGNSASATKLQTARNINGVAFDGSENINILSNSEKPVIGANLGGRGWVRIARVTGSSYEQNGSVLLTFGGVQSDSKPNAQTILISLGVYNNAMGASFVQLNGGAGNQITKVRVLRGAYESSTISYIEIYASESANQCRVQVKSLYDYNSLEMVNFTAGEIPEGYTSTEFTLSANPIKASAAEFTGEITASGVICKKQGTSQINSQVYNNNNKVYMNECGGDYRGAVLDITECANYAASKLLHTGNYTDYVVPKTGGYFSERVQITGTNYPLFIVNKAQAGYSYVRFFGQDTHLGSLGFTLQNNPAFITNDDQVRNLLHTGNSAPVVISATAPSDTSSLWIDNVNMVQKIYKNGAWTALS